MANARGAWKLKISDLQHNQPLGDTAKQIGKFLCLIVKLRILLTQKNKFSSLSHCKADRQNV
jgi:hypothetical protein